MSKSITNSHTLGRVLLREISLIFSCLQRQAGISGSSRQSGNLDPQTGVSGKLTGVSGGKDFEGVGVPSENSLLKELGVSKKKVDDYKK